MILPFCKNLTPIAIALICFVACSKENSDPASLLMSKAWYPYQVEIIMIDSNRTFITDQVTGEQKETDKVLKTDTVYLTPACQQKSLYQFKTNGVEMITNLCSNNSSAFPVTWSITQTGEMFFSQFATTPISTKGFLTEINKSQFVFNGVLDDMHAFGNSTDAEGNQVQTADVLLITTILTFKSR
jgi:hypothetical protein